MKKKNKTDYVRIRQMYDDGMGVSEIGRKIGRTKGAVSKALKKMDVQVTRAVVKDAPKYLAVKDREAERLDDLYTRVMAVLDRLEEDDHGTKLEYTKEARLIIGTIRDCQYKLFRGFVWSELLKKLDEAISDGCETCQTRIRAALDNL